VKAATDLDAAIMSGDSGRIVSMIDADALLKTVTAGVSAPQAFNDGFVRSMKTSGIGEIFAAVHKGKGNYRVLKVFVQDGKTQAICRLIIDGALNYHDWILARGPDGTIRATDVYIAVTGEYISQTLHRVYIMAAAAADTGIMSRLMGTDRAILDHASDLQAMTASLTSRRYQEVLDIYNRLPASLQREKAFFLQRLMASEKLNDAHPGIYPTAIADYEKAFPGDPSLDLVSIDGLLLAKDYPACRRSIDRLDQWTGSDPYLDVLRGGCDILEGSPARLARAKAEYEEGIAREPTLVQAYWGLVTASLKQKDFATTAATLTRIEKDLHIKLKDLRGSPIYGEFVKSDAYKEWIAAQGAE
jgi:hypothetical protein